MVASTPARAEEPPGKATAAASAELEKVRQWNREVVLLNRQGKYDQALAYALRVLDSRETALRPDDPLVADALHNVATQYRSLGYYALAEPLYRRALVIREKVLGPDHLDVATSLNGLAKLFLEQGDFARAEPLHLRTLSIREKVLGPYHLDVATALDSLATLYVEKGDYARAEPLYQRALAIRERTLDPGHPDIATSLHNVGTLYAEKGNYTHAELVYQRALASREKSLGPDHPDVATSLNSLATLYREKGDYALAEPLYKRALAIRESALGSNHPDVATSLNDLATLYLRKGDSTHAEPLAQRALVIRERALSADHPSVANTLDTLATLSLSKGGYADAESLYQRALGVREKALGPDHPRVAISLGNLASLFGSTGDYARAEPLYLRAQAILERARGLDHPDVATALSGLAALYNARGDDARAERLYQRALAILEKALGPNHPDVASALIHLALLRMSQARAPEAMSAAQRATDIEDRNAASILTTGAEEQKLLYANTLVATTSLVISLHIQYARANHDAARLALTTLLRRKGRVLDAMTDIHSALRQSPIASDQKLLTILASINAKIANRVSRGPGDASAEQYRGVLAALEQSREDVEALLSRRSSVIQTEQHRLNLEDIQAKIPDGAALVEISRYKPFVRPADLTASLFGAPRYVAYVLHRSGDPTFADLGAAAPIDAAVDRLRLALADFNLTHDPKPAARLLDRLLMQPLRELLGVTRWVFLSPDGPLNLIPFGALVDEDNKYVVERYLFSYLTTGRDLIRFGDAQATPREAPLILANPSFNDSSAPSAPEASLRGLRSIDMIKQALPTLESTTEEAKTIARIFPESRVLLGPKATEEALKAARAPLLVHLATHGFFLPERPVPDVLLRSPSGEIAPAERAALLQRENPLLRSGIALAGFNQRRSGTDDGVLTALEVTGLDLYGTRLVVLSTCESGVGAASTGEGIYGLRRALTIAGSATQVMSLWQVDTGRTGELMQAYYQRLNDGRGRSEAMRDVQLAMLANPATANPNLWASFIVSGEWRTMDGEARLPDVGRVPPGARGCGCEHAGGEPYQPLLVVALAFGLAATRRMLDARRLAAQRADRGNRVDDGIEIRRDGRHPPSSHGVRRWRSGDAPRVLGRSRA